MKPSEDLFRLIKSLTKGESRYFTLYASKYDAKKSNVIRLFEAVRSQKEYNEASIKAMFKGEKLAKYFATEKSNLYNLILKCLSDYEYRMIEGDKLDSLLRDIKILQNKELYQQSYKLIKKAKKLAYEREAFVESLELITREIDLEEILDLKNRPALYKERTDILKQINNANEFNILADEVYSIYLSKNYQEGSDNYKKLQNLVRNPLLESEEYAQTFTARRNYYLIKVLYNNIINRVEESYYYMVKSVELMDEHPDWILRGLGSYISSVTNIMVLQLELYKIEEAKESLEKFKLIPETYAKAFENDANLEFQHTINVMKIEMELSIKLATFSRVEKFIPIIFSKIVNKESKFRIYNVMDLYYNCAYASFTLNQYAAAVDWCNRINHFLKGGILQDIEIANQIMNALCHFELGNIYHIEHLAKSFERYAKKNKLWTPLIKAIYSFMKSSLATTYPSREKKEKAIQAACIKLKNKFDTMDIDNSLPPMSLFDMHSWLDSKIEKRSFADVLKEKAVQKRKSMQANNVSKPEELIIEERSTNP